AQGRWCTSIGHGSSSRRSATSSPRALTWMYHGVIHPPMRHRHRHERWLHARIPEELEEALKREALRRRWPVSTLVRDVLEGALDMVEHIVEDSVEIARRSRGERPAPPRPSAALDAVYGWQEIILNRDTACASCGSALGTGETAFRGLSDEPGPPAFLCAPCIRRLREPAKAKEHTS